MFQRMIDGFKDQTATAVRLTSLAAAAAIALLIMLAFLCAAAFVFVLQRYGPVEACLTCAAIFLVVALIAIGSYMARKHRAQNQARAREAAKDTKSALHAALGDPMLMTAGIQLIRAVGVKRLIPILAIGGVALGVLASRANTRTPDDEAPEP
jgi:hypothetical protein